MTSESKKKRRRPEDDFVRLQRVHHRAIGWWQFYRVPIAAWPGAEVPEAIDATVAPAPGFPAKDMTLLQVTFEDSTLLPRIIEPPRAPDDTSPTMAERYAAYKAAWNEAALAAWKDRDKVRTKGGRENAIQLSCLIEGDKLKALTRKR